MSALELARTIKAMRKLDMTDEEILAELKRGGYEGDSLPKLDDIIPTPNVEGTKPVITLEEITYEQRMTNAKKITPANEAANIAMNFEIQQRSKK
jgi:hypothetical protein